MRWVCSGNTYCYHHTCSLWLFAQLSLQPQILFPCHQVVDAGCECVLSGTDCGWCHQHRSRQSGGAGCHSFFETFGVVFCHNSLGYLLGWVAGMMAHFNVPKKRTISIEVGMQNAGLATNLATNFCRAAFMVLPCAISCVWHSISGTILAGIYLKWDHLHGYNLKEDGELDGVDDAGNEKDNREIRPANSLLPSRGQYLWQYVGKIDTYGVQTRKVMGNTAWDGCPCCSACMPCWPSSRVESVGARQFHCQCVVAHHGA